MRPPSIVIISPDPVVRERLDEALQVAGLTRSPVMVVHYPGRKELAGLVAGGEPADAVFVDLGEEVAGLATLETVGKLRPSALTVVTNGSRRLSTVVRARQAGAWGYLAEPYDLRPLAEQLGMTPAESPGGPRAPAPPSDGTVLSFIPAKGGAGSSTVAMHVAEAVAEELGGRTLLADLDFQTGIVAFQLGLSPEHTLADALAGVAGGENLDRYMARWGHVDVLAGPPLASAAKSRLAQLPNLFEAARNRYRAVVLDQPTHVDPQSEGAAGALSDRIYVVSTTEIPSLHLARIKIERLRNEGAGDKVRLLLNRIGAWGGLAKDRIERVVGVPVDWVLDNDYAAVRRAVWEGGLVAPETALGSQLRQLGRQIVEDLDLNPASRRRSDAGPANASSARSSSAAAPARPPRPDPQSRNPPAAAPPRSPTAAGI